MSGPEPVPHISPLCGRSDDLDHLAQCWIRALASDGNVVLISGEAGIGKSRLLFELEQYFGDVEPWTARLQCSLLQIHSELQPLRDFLTHAVSSERSRGGVEPNAKLREVLSSANCLPLQMGHHDDLLDKLAETFLADTAVSPLLLIVEDAQWLDPTSKSLIERLAMRCATHRALMVVTARREFDPEWLGVSHSSVVIPRRLKEGDAMSLVEAITSSRGFSPEEQRYIVKRSEGVPLFVEQLSRERPGAGMPPAGEVNFSSGLQSLLMERLEKLGDFRRVAQIVSVLGQKFSHEAGLLLCEGSEDEFERNIVALMAADVLRTQPVARGVDYVFRHALLQEAAYSSLPQSERVRIHARAIQVLTADDGGSRDDRPEILAHHSERAEMYLEAARLWLAAGKRSADRGAVDEAVACFRLGLIAAGRAKRDVERERLEFELDMNLGPALMARNSYASGEALDAFSRARDLLRHSQSSLEEIHVLLGLFNVHFGRGEFVQSLEVGRLADQTLSVGYGGYPVLMGQSLCMMGRLPEARECLERALARYDPALDANSGLFCRADVVATSFLAKVEFSLGNLNRSSELTRSAMTLARQQGHPVALAIAFLGQLFIATEEGDLPAAEEIADQALRHVTAHKLDNYRLWIAFHRAALSLRSEPSAAIVTMHQVMAEADAAGTLTFRPSQLGLLSAAYASIGRTDEALALIDDALKIAETSRGMEAAPALHRLRARAVASTHPAEAIRELEASLSLAHAQSARIEELRSATVLARMLKGTDRQHDAKAQLARLFAAFTDCHKFTDVKQASRVLASLEAAN